MSDRSLSKVIGERAKEIRVAAGATLDDVAKAARSCGAPWTHSRIIKIEAGENSLTVESMLILAMALSRLSDEPLTLATLVDDDGPADKPEGLQELTVYPDDYIEIPKGSNIQAKDVAAWFKGTAVEPILWRQSGPRDWSKIQTILSLRSITRTDRSRHLNENEIADLVRDTVAAAGLVEMRAAESLDTRIGYVAVASIALWGQGLVAERDQRTKEWESQSGKVANAQKRGQITRDLIAELRQSIDSARQGDS